METPEIGDKVRIGSVRLCERQMLAHGFHAYVEGLEGVVIAFLEHNRGEDEGHPWRVDFGRNLSPPGTTPLTWQYFAASELELTNQEPG